MEWSAKHFTIKGDPRIACSHCGECHMNQAFMSKLDALRDLYGHPIMLTSGYRCPDHPVEARKSKSGAHTTGKAVDIACSREEAYHILEVAMRLKFAGIGINQRGAARFIHLDDADPDYRRPRPTIWSY